MAVKSEMMNPYSLYDLLYNTDDGVIPFRELGAKYVPTKEAFWELLRKKHTNLWLDYTEKNKPLYNGAYLCKAFRINGHREIHLAYWDGHIFDIEDDDKLTVLQFELSEEEANARIRANKLNLTDEEIDEMIKDCLYEQHES